MNTNRTRRTHAPRNSIVGTLAAVVLAGALVAVAVNADTAAAWLAGVDMGTVAADGNGAVSTDVPAAPAAPAPADGTFAPTAADREAATAIVSRRDDGARLGMGRWEQQVVHVDIVGSAATGAATAEAEAVLAWLTDVTGATFVHDGGTDMTVHLERGAHPSFRADRQGTTITSVQVVADPAHRRHVWEEIVQSAGAYGDHGTRSDSVLTVDQTSDVPGPFDRWVLASLYGPDQLPDDPSALFD